MGKVELNRRRMCLAKTTLWGMQVNKTIAYFHSLRYTYMDIFRDKRKVEEYNIQIHCVIIVIDIIFHIIFDCTDIDYLCIRCF